MHSCGFRDSSRVEQDNTSTRSVMRLLHLGLQSLAAVLTGPLRSHRGQNHRTFPISTLEQDATLGLQVMLSMQCVTGEGQPCAPGLWAGENQAPGWGWKGSN